MGGSGLQKYLRTRGMEGDEENLFSFGFDAAMGLRSWIRDRPKMLEKCAVQMGFDLWKRDGKSIPPIGGMLSLPAGFATEAERLSGVDAAKELAKRVLANYALPGDFTEKVIDNAFIAVQWRLARTCIYRGEAADLKGDVKNAIDDVSLAKELNDKNPTFQDMVRTQEQRSAQMMQKLTPREGLQLALVRADFTMGKLYAETILAADPENPDANFAMGMFYMKENQLSRAEEYLKRVLIHKPEEPAVYNNLAMIQLTIGKLDAAEVNAKKALKLIPNSAAVQDTLKLIKERRDKKSQK
ncbi:MAG: tetratricopeptide repeat protein [Kiritimatiellae bacterium]|nr:tetratricopeptide repeat protein [Kiritimatiellia bacterium]